MTANLTQLLEKVATLPEVIQEDAGASTAAFPRQSVGTIQAMRFVPQHILSRCLYCYCTLRTIAEYEVER